VSLASGGRYIESRRAWNPGTYLVCLMNRWTRWERLLMPRYRVEDIDLPVKRYLDAGNCWVRDERCIPIIRWME